MDMYSYEAAYSKRSQQGTTLITGLIMLLLLTVIGLAAMDMTTVDVKLLANAKDRQLAFNAAESQLFQASTAIYEQSSAVDNTVQQYRGDAFATNPAWWMDNGNWQALDANERADFAIEQPAERREPAPNGVANLIINNTGHDRAFHEYPVITKALGPGGAEVALSSRFIKRIESNAL